MNVDFWTQWVTLAVAIVAAVSGVWNLLIQLRGKRDSFKVGMGTVSPEVLPEVMMHVISTSEHPITVSDYGFIELDGRLTSIPLEAELSSYISHEGLFRGSTRLEKRGDAMEVGYSRRRAVIGCFALTNLQSRPKISFSYSTPTWTRMKVHCQAWWKGEKYWQ